MGPNWFESPTSYREDVDLCRASSPIGKSHFPPAKVSVPKNLPDFSLEVFEDTGDFFDR